MLFKNTLIKIKKSFGRYLSIFFIVMIGVGFYAGIQATAPDITKIADGYYNNQKLLDFKIVSSLGLTENDVGALKAIDGIKDVVPSYSFDVLNEDKAIRVHAIEEKVNTIVLTVGRKPQSDTECVADGKTYEIGEVVSITSEVNDKLKNTEFTVVGLTESALYISKEYGSTTVGDGRLSSYIFINKSNFSLEAYTEVYATAAKADSAVAYSAKYDNLITGLHDALVKIKPDRENARFDEIYSEANSEISKNETKLNDEKAKAEKELSDAKKELDENAQKLKDAKAELLDNEAKLQDTIKTQNAQFEVSKVKIEQGWNQIDSALKASGITRDEIDGKVAELEAAIQGMEAQLADLHPDDPQ
jgi:putative ABC transport system permease protein